MNASIDNLMCILYKWKKQRKVSIALNLFRYVIRNGLYTRQIFGNELVSILLEAGHLTHAQWVFDNVKFRNSLSWNSMITAYINSSQSHQALALFNIFMEEADANLNGRTFVSLLKVCAQTKDIQMGQQIHDNILKQKLLYKDLFLGSALINMYSECGFLEKAHEVFDSFQSRDTVMWNALITAYIKHGRHSEAFDCYKAMKQDGVSPNSVTYICCLKACGSMDASEQGEHIHAEISSKGLLKENLVLQNAVVDMYAKCGQFEKAHQAFEALSSRSVVSWTAVIAGYAKYGLGEEALQCFEQMQHEGVSPNAITYTCILQACGSIGAGDRGEKIHSDIVRKGLERDNLVASALVDMYVKCGLLDKAQDIFDGLPVHGVVLWTALITGYANHGYFEKALACLQMMELEKIPPNAVTYISFLKACGVNGDLTKGQELHANISRYSSLMSETLVGNALVDMYAKCGLLAKAQEVFNIMKTRDIASWTSLIGGYANQNQGEEALHNFEQMQLDGFSPNAATLVCSLKACCGIGAVWKGQQLHSEVSRKGLESNLLVGSTLVHMYSKCGLVPKAQEIFDHLMNRDIVMWNQLIGGYVQHGESKNVFDLFNRMRSEGKNPDFITFTNILLACKHAGLLNRGHTYFDAMSKEFGVLPTLEHHGCMVDLFCRVGELTEAAVVMKRMPFEPNPVLWRTVLSACQKWGNMRLGIQAFGNAVGSDIEET